MRGRMNLAKSCRKFVCLCWFLSIISFITTTVFVLQTITEIPVPRSLKFSKFQYRQDAIGTRSRQGTVWPQPREVMMTSERFIILPDKFRITYQLRSIKCREVDDAIERYMRIIFGDSPQTTNPDKNAEFVGFLKISIIHPCETYPTIRSSERYVLRVEDREAYLVSSTQWGILRGLETFSQLVHRNGRGEFVVPEAEIEDYPRFPYRGLMLDTARHFLPVETLLKNLEIMSHNKLNVFHWHITDHQSFPIEFEFMPELAMKGAFNNKTMTYKENDVRRVVEFARMRGIRVIPEIDFPGHSSALARSLPHLFLQCHDEVTGEMKDDWRTLNPINPEVYTFAAKLYSELHKLFPDEYIHLGGDEVPHICWLKDPEYQKYADETGFIDNEIHRKMQERLLQEARKLNLKPIMWDDAFNHRYTTTPATVQVWTPGSAELKVADLASGGVDVIVSYPWYLDNAIHKNWWQLYGARITSLVNTEDEKHILGGESCMWGEHIDHKNIFNEVWPLASAVAERLWSNDSVVDVKDAKGRLRSFQCLMETRGFESTPFGPGYCDNAPG